jgi:hypothetical protein
VGRERSLPRRSPGRSRAHPSTPEMVENYARASQSSLLDRGERTKPACEGEAEGEAPSRRSPGRSRAHPSTSEMVENYALASHPTHPGGDPASPSATP